MTANVIFGFLSAVAGPTLPSILIEFLGEENLAVAYGFLLIFEGIGSFVGPPIAGTSSNWNQSSTVIVSKSLRLFTSGMLSALTGRSESAFYLSSGLFFMSGAVMSLPILKFHPKDQQQQPLYSRSTSTMTTQTFDEDDIDCCYEDKLVWKRKHVFQPLCYRLSC